MPLPRPELRGLAPAVHGGDAPEDVLDFSTGVSPLPVPLPILEAVRAADLRRYPHPSALPLRTCIAEAQGCSPDEVVTGNGSAELIWAVARAFGGEGRRVLVLAPAFGEYRQAAAASGAAVDELRAEGPPFEWPEHALLEAVRRRAPSLVFVCRPSNPCLAALSLETLEAAAAAAPDTLFVVDEAYAPLWEDLAPVRRSANIALLRSLTKVFALPGLRLGYLLAAPGVAAAVRATLPPWNVSAPAIAGGMAALAAWSEVSEIRQRITALRASQVRALTAVGAHIQAAGGTFLLCQVGDARRFTQAALSAGIRLRDCTSFGLPRHVRVGVRRSGEEHAALISAWSRAAQESLR